MCTAVKISVEFVKPHQEIVLHVVAHELPSEQDARMLDGQEEVLPRLHERTQNIEVNLEPFDRIVARSRKQEPVVSLFEHL